MNTDLFERIEFELDKRGMYRKDLARNTGVNESTIRNWRNGAVPSAEALYKIADYFDVSVEYLIIGKHQMKNDTLSPDELALVDFYRHLSDADKNTLTTLARILLKNSVSNNVTKSENKQT